MSDLVERLRNREIMNGYLSDQAPKMMAIMEEAAGEIERLRRIVPVSQREPTPWWKDTREWQLCYCRQSGYHFFDDRRLNPRIAAYPGAASEQDARDRFAQDFPDYVLPF